MNNEKMQTLTRQRDRQIVRIQELQQEQETNTADYDKIIEKLSALKTYLLRVIKHQDQKLAATAPDPEDREVEIVSQLLGPQNVNPVDGTIIPNENEFTQKEQQDENTAENLGQQFAEGSEQGLTKQAASNLSFQPQPVDLNQNILKVVDIKRVHEAISMVLPSIYENKEIGDEQMMEIVNTLFLSDDSSDIMSGDQTAQVGRKFNSLPFKPRDPNVALSLDKTSPTNVEIYFDRFKNLWGIENVLPGDETKKWRDTYKKLAVSIMNKVNSCMQEDETQVQPVISEEESLQQDAMAGVCLKVCLLEVVQEV